MSGPDQPTPPSHAYSRAFEALVQEGEEPDLEGLLAYAFFKQSIRERVRSGEQVPPALRRPTASEIEAFRGRATRVLEQYAQGSVAEAAPDIAEAARLAAKSEIIAALTAEIGRVSTAVGRVEQTVKDRTSAWPAIWCGVAAWFISIVITVFITLAAPGWVMNLVNHVAPQERAAPK